MYATAHTHPFHRVIDADTGADIPDVLWADDDDGVYCALLRNAEGALYVDHTCQNAAREVRHRRFKILPPGEPCR